MRWQIDRMKKKKGVEKNGWNYGRIAEKNMCSNDLDLDSNQVLTLFMKGFQRC